MLWLPAWQKWKPRNGRLAAHSDPANCDSGQFTAASPNIIDILRQRSFWGTTVGHFSCNYLFYFMITWLPSYLVFGRHLSMSRMTRIAGMYYTVDAVSAMAAGWLQDFWIRQGYTPTLVRKTAMAIGFSGAAIAVMGCALAGSTNFVPWLMAAGVGCGITGPGIYAFCQRLAGPEAVGRWYGPQNGFANLAGVIGPALTGFVVQRTGNFLLPFEISAAICVVGAIAWVFIVGRIEPVMWAQKREASAVLQNY